MERTSFFNRKILAAARLATSALLGCTVDSYLTNPAGVDCDGRRTMVDLASDGVATFVVHGIHEGAVSTITVRRSHNQTSVAVEENPG